MNRVRQFWPWWRCALTGSIALALALSSYLSWHYVAGGAVIGCSGGEPCDQVLHSRWSSVGGVLPVSGLAAGAYLAMLVASLSIGPATAAGVRRLAWRALLVLVGAAAGSAVWFTVVQKWIIGSFCPYCIATHLIGLLLAVLVVWRAPLQFDENPAETSPTNLAPPAAPSASSETKADDVSAAGPRRIIGVLPAIGLVLVGIAAAGVMAVCQVVSTPKAAWRDGESQANAAAIDAHLAPIAGSPDAPYIVDLLFDYECPHCQQLHFMLEEAMRRYGGKLAFALCPAPLSSQCNPYIPPSSNPPNDSCELAKIALAVWVARHDAFAEFDRWMFSHDSGERWRPRNVDAARTKAVELVGAAKFAAARADPWIERYLQTSIRIYGDTMQGSGAVPKLVFGSRWVVPQPRNANDLVGILRDRLGVPPP